METCTIAAAKSNAVALEFSDYKKLSFDFDCYDSADIRRGARDDAVYFKDRADSDCARLGAVLPSELAACGLSLDNLGEDQVALRIAYCERIGINPQRKVHAAILVMNTWESLKLTDEGHVTPNFLKLLEQIHGIPFHGRYKWNLPAARCPQVTVKPERIHKLFRLEHGSWRERGLGDSAAVEQPAAARKRTRWIEDETTAVEIDWLVDEAVQRGGVGFLAGASGAGKTFVLIHKAVCGALGKPFFGRQIAKPFGTYLVAAEGAHSIPSRVKACATNVFGLTAEEAHRLPIAYCDEVPNLLSKAGLESFLAELENVQRSMLKAYGVPLGAVDIDTFGQAFAIEDENAATQITRATKPMQIVARATSATVMATHHFGHGAQRMRGSTAIRANADFVLEARKDGELFLEKCRDGAEVRLGFYGLPIVNVGTKADGRPITSRFVQELTAPRTDASDIREGFSAVKKSDFEVAFEEVATEADDGWEAPAPAVREQFAKLRASRGLSKGATRQAWSDAIVKAKGQGYVFDGALISKRF